MSNSPGSARRPPPGGQNIDRCISLIMQRIKDQFLQNWRSRLDLSSRAVFYKHIACFRFQPYLDLLNVSKYRISFSRLRLVSHRLCIEVGRWHRPVSIPVNERLCTTCNILEDEYHFVMECQLYVNIRKQRLPAYYWKRPNMFKFTELINTESIRILKNLSIYVKEAFEIRNNIMYIR